jgi:hypothetical protein
MRPRTAVRHNEGQLTSLIEVRVGFDVPKVCIYTMLSVVLCAQHLRFVTVAP